MGRIVGISHRIKKNVEGEARPTKMAIYDQGQIQEMELETEMDELDFVRGSLPVAWREINPEDDLEKFLAHHIKWRKVKEGEVFQEKFLKKEKGVAYVATKIPAKFDGLKEEDQVAMVLGGSGDNFAFALSRKGETIGAKVFRVPAFLLKENREKIGEKKENDAIMLVTLFEVNPKIFYELKNRDRDLIKVRESFRLRQYAMEDRIACGQRVRQHTIGKIFCNPEGFYPEGDLEKICDESIANDAILLSLEQEEKRRQKEMEKAIENLDVYQEIFSKVDGCGPRIAAGIVSVVIDIRRFSTSAKLKKFCGVHVMDDGKFYRRRRNQKNNSNPEARQSLYLLAGLFVKRPKSKWGVVLNEYKKIFRAKHPEIIVVDGKKKYTDGHIHKMALWRTLTKFVEWLHKEWWSMEEELAAQSEKSDIQLDFTPTIEESSSAEA